jgi:CheY-like chemotaxis protein
MVVEDEPSIYEILLTMFEMWGIDGVAFVDGEEAVKWIEDVDSGRQKGELPELALIDIRLPGRTSGPMVGERLRKSPQLKDIAIVLTTAYRMSMDEERAFRLQAGADDWIQKPLPKFSDLKKRLEKVLAERRIKPVEVVTQPAIPPPSPAPTPAAVNTAAEGPPAKSIMPDVSPSSPTIPVKPKFNFGDQPPKPKTTKP